MNDVNIQHVYIHIPFCKKICPYCNFTKILYQEELASMYLDSLAEEIKEKVWNKKIKTLYIGGGTPSVLSISNLKKLFSVLLVFDFEDDYEFTFEVNVEDIREELLEVLKASRVNRLSIGVQSFNRKKLDLMNRNSDFKDMLLNIKHIRNMGFNNISLDLIYGFSFETKKILKKDLKMFLKLKPDHISTYSLSIEENTIFKIKDIKSTTEGADLKLYKLLKKFLMKKGYNHYEISNFAKTDKASHHNLVYWNNEEYYGFGLSASGYINGVRYKNTSNMKSYLNKDFTVEKEILSKTDLIKYELILGFRKTEGINKKNFFEKYKLELVDYPNIKVLLEEKYLIQNNTHIYLNTKYQYLLNEILLKLI